MDRAMCYKIIFVFLLVPAYVPAISIVENGGKAAEDDTCNDPECKDMAAMIKKQMTAKQPCDDFHNYVCGNWEGDLELSVTHLKKKAVITLSDLLGNASASYKGNFRARDKLVHAYESCTKNGRSNESLKTSVKKVLKRYNAAEWPIIGTNGRDLPLSPKNAYMNVLKKTGPRPVFSYSVYEDGSNTVILMTKPREFYVSEAEAYASLESRSYSSDVEGASELPPDNYDDIYDQILQKEEDAYKIFIKNTIRLLNESVSEDKAMEVAEDIVRIENGFAKAAKEANDSTERRVNISDLDAFVGNGFLMTPILKRDFKNLSIEIKKEMEVIVRYMEYYKKAVHFMTCITPVALTNYILWTKIRKMAEATGTLLNDIYLEYKNNTSSPDHAYVDESPEVRTAMLKVRCMRQLLETGVMYTAGAHYFVMEKFNESAKNDVLKMMEFVNSSFMHVVTNNTWMSETTRAKSIERLQTMSAVIGYPDWLLNETIINFVYRFVPNIGKNASFVEHFHFLLENDHKQTLFKLKPEMYFNKVDETITLRSHAFYVDSSNSLVYPAAALVTHYRGKPIPRSLNFGAIGTVLAQLFVTSIERYSHLPSETGKYYEDKWDKQTTGEFCKRASCLNNTEECNDTSPSGRDKHEKLRDYLGLRISFEAMQKSKQNYTSPFLLPDKEKFDNENKIFFILFGSLYCPISVNENRVQGRSDDAAKYHDSLNEIVYTYMEFNKTFKCKINPPADTCQLMPPDGPTPLPNC